MRYISFVRISLRVSRMEYGRVGSSSLGHRSTMEMERVIHEERTWTYKCVYPSKSFEGSRIVNSSVDPFRACKPDGFIHRSLYEETLSSLQGWRSVRADLSKA